MKKLSLTCLLVGIILASSALCAAQQKTEPTPATAPSARVEVAPEAQQSILIGQANMRAAQAALDAAQLRLENLILKLRLLLKVPDDFELRVDEHGKFFFEKPTASAATK